MHGFFLHRPIWHGINEHLTMIPKTTQHVECSYLTLPFAKSVGHYV